jgi:opacity protein-like surface antigen
MLGPRLRCVLTLAGLVLGAAARPAHAQLAVLLPSFGLGVHGGAFSARDGDTGGFGGAHARLRLLPFLGLEAAASIGEASFPQDVTIREVPIQFSALLYLIPFGPLQLYVAGGAGYYDLHVEPKGLSAHTDDQVGYHGGGGLDLPLGRGLVLNVDGRYQVLEDKVTGRPGQRLDLDGWQVRGGLTYYFW